MAFNVNQFQAEMTKNGIAKTSDFEVEITGAPVSGNVLESSQLSLGSILSNPVGTVTDAVGDFLGGIFGTGTGGARSMSFRIDSVTFPQRSLGRIDYKDYGAPYNIGSLANYVNIDFSVILSPDLREREFFMQWQDRVTGNHRTGGSNFDIGYYDQYVLKQGFTIYQLNPNGQRTYAIRLVDCYPEQIASLSGNWSATDVQKQNVTMAYRYFTEERLETSFTFDLDNVASAFNAVKNLPNQIKGRSKDALNRAGFPLNL
jgi:hypothetical protein